MFVKTSPTHQEQQICLHHQQTSVDHCLYSCEVQFPKTPQKTMAVRKLLDDLTWVSMMTGTRTYGGVGEGNSDWAGTSVCPWGLGD